MSSKGRDEPRIATIAHIYLNTVGGDFSVSTFSAFVDALQLHEPLTSDELWNLESHPSIRDA